MKRILICSMALMLLLALSVPARADIMWEPSDNLFFETHGAGCRYESRSYYANGSDGFVTLLEAPGGSMVRAQYENGEVLWVGYTYGNDWALVSRWEDGKEISGWVPRTDLAEIYDYISFQEEYADQISDYNGEFADYAGTPEAVNFYEYPGAPEISQSFEVSNSWGGDILENLTGTGEHSSCISRIFVDENGLTWGFVGYMYGHRNSWFCLDRPDGTDFPLREVSVPELTPAQAPVLPAGSYTPYILVALVIAVTGAIMICFYGRKRKSAD